MVQLVVKLVEMEAPAAVEFMLETLEVQPHLLVKGMMAELVHLMLVLMLLVPVVAVVLVLLVRHLQLKTLAEMAELD